MFFFMVEKKNEINIAAFIFHIFCRIFHLKVMCIKKTQYILSPIPFGSICHHSMCGIFLSRRKNRHPATGSNMGCYFVDPQLLTDIFYLIKLQYSLLQVFYSVIQTIETE